jgi:class 3 adenylate cyclase
LLLYFPDSAGAVRTGMALQEAFEAESASTGLPLWVRMGMHAGEARERGDDLVGHDVNVAARIVNLSGPGEVLVSEALRERAAEGIPCVNFEEVGPTVMRGIPEPVNLYRVVRSDAS